MKSFIFLILGFFIWQDAISQTKPVTGTRSQYATATTTLSLYYIGVGEKDLSIINFDTDTDTLIVFRRAADTAAALWQNRVLVFPGSVENGLTRFIGDTLYVKSSGSTPFYFRSVNR